MLGINLFSGSHYDQYEVEFIDFRPLTKLTSGQRDALFTPPPLCDNPVELADDKHTRRQRSRRAGHRLHRRYLLGGPLHWQSVKDNADAGIWDGTHDDDEAAPSRNGGSPASGQHGTGTVALGLAGMLDGMSLSELVPAGDRGGGSNDTDTAATLMGSFTGGETAASELRFIAEWNAKFSKAGSNNTHSRAVGGVASLDRHRLAPNQLVRASYVHWQDYWGAARHWRRLRRRSRSL
jgi:hypothetical protein